MNKSVKVRAYGKLNLFLDITGRREDGYHLLRSVMQSVSVYDELTFELAEGSGIKLECDDPNFPLNEKNLVWKAITAFVKYTGKELSKLVKVSVKKNIPAMAGMAGGSADCAAALAAMNVLTGAKLDSTQLCEIGAALGADVPFTLTGGTVLCEGIGEKLTSMPDLKGVCFAVVKPDVGISTPEAYRVFDSCGHCDAGNFESFYKAAASGDAVGISKNIYNALEIAADAEEICTAKAEMINGGALNSMMTGSGSAVFGIFTDRQSALNCIENMKGYSFAQVLEPVPRGWEFV